MRYLERAEQKIWEFQRQGGRLENVTKESLKAQINLIKEELEELEEAVEFNQPIETLDGIADLLVTSIGFAQMLETQDYVVWEALDKVADNNLEKRIWTEEEMSKTLEKYSVLGIEVVFDFDQVSGSWMCKRKDTQKVLKPEGFRPVQLKVFVPAESE